METILSAMSYLEKKLGLQQMRNRTSARKATHVGQFRRGLPDLFEIGPQHGGGIP